MVHTGRLEGYGIGKETTRGTVVAPSVWLQQTEGNFDDKFEKVADESTVWVLMQSTTSEKTKQYAEGEITGIASIQDLPLVLLSLLWSVSSALLSSGVYAHTFSMSNVNTKPTLTISKKTPLEAFAYANAMISSLTISAKIGEEVLYKFAAKSKASAAATLTKAYAQANKLYTKHLNVYFADNIAGLSGASAECWESIELSLTQEIEEAFCFSSGVDIGDIFNKGFAIDVKGMKKKTDLTYENYVKNWTVKAMRIEIIDTATDLGGTNRPKISFTLSKVTFEECNDDGGLDDIKREEIVIRAHYDITAGSEISAVIQNKTASY